jgi:ubiquinone/menaquinone biosynthesis C-methylase UbiE
MVKAYKGLGMKGSVARWYARITRGDLPTVRELAGRIAAGLPAAARVLEVAPGPGYLAIELARRGLTVEAVDISPTFVDIARDNTAAADVDVRFAVGNAAALPIPAGSFDFIVCRAAFKNFVEPVKALEEMRRVLRPGGQALLIDLRRDVSMAELRRYVDGMGVGWWNRRLIMLVFRHMLIRRAATLADVRRMMAEAGWIDPRIETTPVGFEAWMTR